MPISRSTRKPGPTWSGKIECARFEGTTPDVFLDQATIEGPVFSTVEPTVAFIKRNIALGSTIGEVYRTDRWEYPLEALREAIINAVVHRDYRIAGSDIKVAIFDDMLEITSPGALPDGITPEATTEVPPEARLASVLDGELSRKEIMDRLSLKNEEHFRKTYLVPALEAGLIERTIPAKPRSSKQRYRLTPKGRGRGL